MIFKGKIYFNQDNSRFDAHIYDFFKDCISSADNFQKNYSILEDKKSNKFLFIEEHTCDKPVIIPRSDIACPFDVLEYSYQTNLYYYSCIEDCCDKCCHKQFCHFQISEYNFESDELPF